MARYNVCDESLSGSIISTIRNTRWVGLGAIVRYYFGSRCSLDDVSRDCEYGAVVSRRPARNSAKLTGGRDERKPSDQGAQVWRCGNWNATSAISLLAKDHSTFVLCSRLLPH